MVLFGFLTPLFGLLFLAGLFYLRKHPLAVPDISGFFNKHPVVILQLHQVILIGLVALLISVLIRTAWVSDDAFITFRTSFNLASGYGLTWNVDERVQAYTNPLWMLLHTLLYLVTGNIYISTMVFSFGFTLALIYIMVSHLAMSREMVIPGLLILLFSKSFIDFSSSGLENPLSHFLLTIFVLLLFKYSYHSRIMFWLTFVASLSALNRADTLIFYLPTLALLFYRKPDWKNAGWVALGISPLVLWELFSLFYYGFPFPNTAYAKLNTGIDLTDRISQGFIYYLDLIDTDPLTFVILLITPVVILATRQRQGLGLLAGIFGYLIYIIYIGGDFMTGRFFSTPLVASVILLISTPWYENRQITITLGGGILLLGLMNPFSTVFSDSSYRVNEKPATMIRGSGIADERGYYYYGTGLLRMNRDSLIVPDHPFARWGLGYKTGLERVVVSGVIGMVGYFAGPHIHIIDFNALADPLLARLPYFPKTKWRAGHLARVMPHGYMETLRSGNNVILDENIKKYYDQLALITGGELFSLERLQAIWKMNTGQFDSLLKFPNDLYPPFHQVNLSDVSTPRPVGTGWSDYRNFVISRAGIEVILPGVYHSSTVEISADNSDVYRIEFYRQKSMLAKISFTMPVPTRSRGGLTLNTLAIPEEARTNGFDRVKVFPVAGDDRFSLGHLIFRD